MGLFFWDPSLSTDQPYLLMASVHILNLYTSVNLLSSFCHHFAMSGTTTNGKPTIFLLFLLYFPIQIIYSSRPLFHSFSLVHTLIFPAVVHHFVYLLLIV